MNVRTQETVCSSESAEPADEVLTGLAPPGFQESLVLAMDSVLTFIRLFKVESSLALSALPVFIVLNIARLPVYVLTWLSFAVLIATAVYTLTGNLLLTASAFFLLQLGLALLLERMLRSTKAICSLPETRKSMVMAVAGLKERFKDGQNHSEAKG